MIDINIGTSPTRADSRQDYERSCTEKHSESVNDVSKMIVRNRGNDGHSMLDRDPQNWTDEVALSGRLDGRQDQ